MDDADFAGLIERARGGDEASIAELLRTFEPEVRTMVRVRLPRMLRSQFDSMDFTQAVLSSFVGVIRRTERQFENAKHLEAFLAGIARNKVYEEHRRLTRTRKYDLRREEQLYVRKGDREVPRELASPDPTPSEQVQERDLIELLKSGGSTEAAIVEQRLQGKTFTEIAEHIRMHERSVRRTVEAMRSRLESRA